jgi:hypothetical protein
VAGAARLAHSVGFPRTEVAYSYDEKTTLFAGASFESTAYAIDDPAIVAPAGSDLRETELENRAVKATLGVQRKFGSRCSARLEGGAAIPSWRVKARVSEGTASSANC